MNVIITGYQGFAKYPNVRLKKYAKNPVAATGAIIKFEEEYAELCRYIAEFSETHSITKILSMSRDGLDQSVEKWALGNSKSVKRFKPNWLTDGSRAAYLKSLDMAAAADAGLFILKAEDSTSSILIKELRRAGKPLRVLDLR